MTSRSLCTTFCALTALVAIAAGLPGPARGQSPAPAPDLTLYGAGSLREAMTEITAAFRRRRASGSVSSSALRA